VITQARISHTGVSNLVLTANEAVCHCRYAVHKDSACRSWEGLHVIVLYLCLPIYWRALPYCHQVWSIQML